MDVLDEVDRAAVPLHAYVPRLVTEWLSERPGRQHLAIDGSMALLDISGFTALTERLARKGKLGAEEMSDILNRTFAALIEAARPDGADLLKWGGDAILLLFRGPRHAAHAARAAYRMRKVLRLVGRTRSSVGQVELRMSVGIHSGEFHLFLVGDPAIHRELLVVGPSASRTAELESIAAAGQVALSDRTASMLAPAVLGATVTGGRLLRSEPHVADVDTPVLDPGGTDLAAALPPPLRSNLVAAAGESEHRPIAVAFVQFSGTDALITQRGPEAAAVALDECVRNVQHSAVAFDVTFLESDVTGDGGRIMLTAGAPRSRGDDEERMLRTVRRVVDRAGTLPLRAGINRGSVFCGDFGPAARRTYSVKGDAVNVAARVLAQAEIGQVLATREVTERSSTFAESEALAPFMVKGKSQPLHAVVVGTPGAERAGDLTEGAFVGRDHEIATLVAAFESARSGRGCLVEVIGEPGIGKSRLIHEAMRLASGLVVVEARSGSYQTQTAYYPFRTLLRRTLGIAVDATAEAAGQRLGNWVTRNASHLQPWLPLLAVVLDADLPSSRMTDELDEMFRREKLAEVTLEFLHMILPAPTLLVFEDVHLADEASADLLARLERDVHRRPWAVVVTRRAHGTGFAPDPSAGHVQLLLAAIDESAALVLLEAATTAAPLSSQAMRAIAAKAGGNPLFLGALILAASRSGSVADLPDSVEGVVTSQIDRLEPRARTLLRYAAVLGVRFSLPVLREMVLAHGQGVDDEALERLGDFIEPDGEGWRRFRHAVIREVAYAGLPYRRRRAMHEHVGVALEQARSDREDLADRLSMHFFYAGTYDKAWTYSRAAGERARARYAYCEAMEFLERALESAVQARQVQPDQVASVYEELGDVRDIAGLSREAAEAYRRARRFVLADPVRRSALLFKQASIDQRIGEFTTSLRLLSRGRRILADASGVDADAARSRLATRYSFGRYLQGRYSEAMRWSAIGANEARDAGDREALAYAYSTMYLAHMHAGRAEDEPYGDLALAIYEETGDLRMQGHCLNNLAIGAMQDGRWELSASLLERAAGLFRRIGDIANEANARYNEADLRIRQGRFAEVEPVLASALRAARAADDRELVALVLRETGRMYSGLGRWDEAIERFDQARSRFTGLGLAHELAALDGALAECLALSGRSDEAVTVAREALARARALHADLLLAALHRSLGFGLLASARFDEARTVFTEGLRLPDHADGRHEHALMMMGLAQVPGRAPGDDTGEMRRRGQRILDGLGVVDAPVSRLLR